MALGDTAAIVSSVRQQVARLSAAGRCLPVVRESGGGGRWSLPADSRVGQSRGTPVVAAYRRRADDHLPVQRSSVAERRERVWSGLRVGYLHPGAHLHLCRAVAIGATVTLVKRARCIC